MKKKLLLLTIVTLMASLLLSLPFTVSAASFQQASHKPSVWAESQVNEAIAAKLVPQTLQSKYTQAITRTEFCTLVVALYEAVKGEPILERVTFHDTIDINVQKSAAIGVVGGTGDGYFSPDVNLTREQAAVILSALAEVLEKPLTENPPSFFDKGDISLWALTAVGQVQADGIMGGIGNNTFTPRALYTREQSIVTILKLYHAVKGTA